MQSILIHAHSGLRWVALILLLAAIGNAFSKWQGKKGYTDKDRKLGLFALIGVHVQLLLGLALYFISSKVIFSAESMKVAMNRFFLVEHPTLMIIAIALITVGYSRAKRGATDTGKFKTTFWFYLIGLILILAGIPWPSLGYGTGWF